MSDQISQAQAVEAAQNALADARRDGDPQAIKVAQQGLVNAQAEQHQGVATPDQHRERSGLPPMPAMPPTKRGGIKFAEGGVLDNVAEREAQRVADEERRAAEAADEQAAADEVVCGFVDVDDECGDDRLLYRVSEPERGLNALIPPRAEIVCPTHLLATLAEQNFEDGRTWSVSIVSEPV